MFKKLKRRKVVLSFLISYICILAIPIIISSIIYIRSTSIIEEEINNVNKAMLKQIQQNIDNHLQDIENLSVQIALDKKAQQLLYTNSKFTEKERYIMKELVENMSSYIVANKFIEYYYIYLKNENVIITPESVYWPRLAYDFLHKNDELDYEDWYNLMNAEHTKKYIPIKVREYSGEVKNSIAFLQSLPIDNSNNIKGNAIILLNEEKLYQSIENIQAVNNGLVFIIDQENNVLFSTESIKLPQSVKYNILNESDEIFNSIINDENVLVSYMKSEVVDWKYVSIIPEHIFMKKVNDIRILTLMAFIICTLIGSVMAYFFTIKNYNPIREVVQMINQRVGKPLIEESDEFNYIKRTVERTISEKENIQERLKKQEDVLKNNFLLRLIKGKIKNNIEIQSICDTYDIHFNGDYFAVMLFYIDNFDHSIFNINEDEDQTFKLLYFVIQNVVEELANNTFKAYAVETDGIITSLINIKESDKEEVKNILLKIANEAKDFLEQKFKITLSISISMLHNSYEGIGLAYQEALDAIEYKWLLEENQIIHYNDITSTGIDTGINLFEEEQSFMNCIKANDYQRAEEILDRILKKNFYETNTSLQITKCRMFGLVNTMINAMGEIKISCEDTFWDSLKPIERLLACKTVIELQDEMKYILGKVDSYIKINKKNNEDQVLTDIEDFIKLNYSNVDLSLSMIANEFNMNQVYLSKFFKKETGEGILDRIHKIRIKQAKLLLKEKDNSVKNIAENVGYYNSNSFIRAFKRYEGITPGTYKKM